jgi:hypothetical protein
VILALAVMLGEVVRSRRALTAETARRLRLAQEERTAEAGRASRRNGCASPANCTTRWRTAWRRSRCRPAPRGRGVTFSLGGDVVDLAETPYGGPSNGIGVGAAAIVLLIAFGSLLAMGLPIATL